MSNDWNVRKMLNLQESYYSFRTTASEWLSNRQRVTYLRDLYWTDLVACGMHWVPFRAAAVKAPTTLIHMTACVAKKNNKMVFPFSLSHIFSLPAILGWNRFEEKIVTRWVARMTATNTSITKEYIITSRVKPDGKTPEAFQRLSSGRWMERRET
jgi:hypothetical protein